MDYIYQLHDNQNFRFSITVHLANHNKDKELAAILTNIQRITFIESGQYYDRWNVY